jgi:hypothetical protein
MLDNTSDFKSLICYIILLLIFIAVRKKNYLILTFSWSFTSYSLGGGDVFGLPFARHYLLLLYIFTFYFLISPNKPPIGNKKFGFFNILLFIILFKIVLDSLVYGFDDFRSETLVIGFHVLILSMYIFHKSFELFGFEKTIKDFVWSGLFIHGIISVILFYSIFQNQLIPALGVGHRITIFNQDTINSAKPFYFYIVFLLAAIQHKFINKKYLIVFAYVIAVLCLIVVILNGSRQYIIGLFFVVIFPLIKLNVKTSIIIGLTIIMLPILSSIIENNFSDLAIIERFSGDELSREQEDGRSAIWEKGFNQMFSESPIWGLGFRNFGTIHDASNPDSPTVVIRKDNAHGFFQEVFIEHGVILGILLSISFLFSFFKLRTYLVNNSMFNSIFIILIGFIIPNFFTGYILSSMGYYFLGLFLYNYPKLSINK